MKITAAPLALSRALLLAIFFLCLGSSAACAANSADTSTAPQFPYLRLEQHAKPPASCDASIYGAVASRAPDGALCLCHVGFNGKPGFWEQIGTGRACWPAPK
jgi:hypothetical protein